MGQGGADRPSPPAGAGQGRSLLSSAGVAASSHSRTIRIPSSAMILGYLGVGKGGGQDPQPPSTPSRIPPTPPGPLRAPPALPTTFPQPTGAAAASAAGRCPGWRRCHRGPWGGGTVMGGGGDGTRPPQAAPPRGGPGVRGSRGGDDLVLRPPHQQHRPLVPCWGGREIKRGGCGGPRHLGAPREGPRGLGGVPKKQPRSGGGNTCTAARHC